ncbi:hypothetical protein [Clostridium frigidicarnis]|uniref:Uncharacterized protein n=1 Tax=Clostridium frigidicarnis TaxID=84698 RepID=A0A1I0XS32_9CLOT|nr:hypothetical protein [Clostridium frigidicarnis]SFB03865.1 hypothetical protein SAMN04488528_1009136 [Clostridium frigidicarnis]
MIKKNLKIAKTKKIIILFFIIILSIITIKLVTSSDQSGKSDKTYIISGDDNEEDSVNNTENIITLKEESLLGEWEFDTNIQNKAYSKPSKIKLNFKNNSDVITDIYLLDHGDYITGLSEDKYKIEKNKNGETSINILYNIDPSMKDKIDPKYGDYAFKFIIKEFEENKIDVEFKYTSKESKKETLEGSLIKINKSN